MIKDLQILASTIIGLCNIGLQYFGISCVAKRVRFPLLIGEADFKWNSCSIRPYHLSFLKAMLKILAQTDFDRQVKTIAIFSPRNDSRTRSYTNERESTIHSLSIINYQQVVVGLYAC